VTWVTPDPPLQAGEVLLRPFRVEDAQGVVAACTDPAILRFTFMKEGLTRDEAVEWIERSNARWADGHPRFASVDAVDDRLLGQVGAAVDARLGSAEAYYWVAPDDRGRGVAVTALTLLGDWLFANGVERLYLLVHPDNDASNRVAHRCGFTREGVLRAYEPFKGGRPDLVSWSLLPNDPRQAR
jgi:RimJ/RimL family protein N-acetyltransferase